MTDPISDFLTRIRNAASARHRSVDIPASNLKAKMAEILKNQGFIEDFEKLSEGPQGTLRLMLRYVNGSSAMIQLKRISRPGLRKYAKYSDLPRVKNGLGLAIVSTSQGLMTDKEARYKKIGGEVICYIW